MLVVMFNKKWAFMSEVKRSYIPKNIQTEFDLLLNNLDKVYKEIRPKSNILNTKLGKIKKDLLNIENLDKNSLAKLCEIVVKYNSINYIFNNNIEYNKKDLVKIIEGKSNYIQDSDEVYNNYFFELSMGVRFLLAFKKLNLKINLDTVCDVLIDDNIAIECKYIHSSSNLVKNIRAAKKQIEKRITDGEAENGFISLDLSHIFPKEKVQEFASYTFDKFIKNYERLRKKRRIEGDILQQIINDTNFSKIINSYILRELETSLYEELGFSYDMGDKVLAIIFQSMNSFTFEYEEKIHPLTTRAMTYFLNTKLNESETLKTQEYIHKLAVGL